MTYQCHCKLNFCVICSISKYTYSYSFFYRSGVFMSELLYLYDKIDWRFCPLVTAVRQWAAWAKLTSPTPGNQITNFTLTLMVVFFLQRRTPPILPTLGEMIKLARSHVDTRQTEDINCTFLRDPSVFQKRKELNSESLEDLFMGFLRFFGSFDFNERSISIITGDSNRKLDSKPLYVQNPLERELNVSRNVTLTELTRAVMEARNALYILETQDHQSPGENWGLLTLPRAKSMRQIKQDATHLNSMNINIEDLFCADSDEEIVLNVKKVPDNESSSPQTSSPIKQSTEEEHTVSGSNATNGVFGKVQQQNGLNGSTKLDMRVLFSEDPNVQINNMAESKPSKANIVSKTSPSSIRAPLVSSSNATNGFADQVQGRARSKVNKTPANMVLKSERNRRHVEKHKIK